ncbi:MAG TPA: molybdopterin-dependent oxidoreductase, partial [Anaerolineales bacterium]|nr:molybdopterin-dependent oxidoreductase [Anaerolineales bacterium]
MSDKISRRDFLKLAGVGAATTAVLTGCGPASRYVTREPYVKMPEYNYNGLSTYYATTCRECAAGCGIVVRTMQGRAIKVEGNPNHPVNLGKTCARGQATLHGLYNPDRVQNPGKHTRGANVFSSNKGNKGSDFQELTWLDATQVVADALTKNKPDEIAFLVGMAPDHLFDLVTDLTKALGAPAPVRFGALGMFDGRATLMKAAEDLFGQSGLPFFDLGNSDLVLSFGANFLETWLSPVAQTRAYSQMRRGQNGKRGYLIQFEPRMSQTGAKADEWIPIAAGTEALVALAIGRLAAEAKGVSLQPAFANVDVDATLAAAGVSKEKIDHIVKLFTDASSPIAIPGGMALAHDNGLQTAEAVLALNAFANNLGRNGGVFLSPLAPLTDEYHRPASIREMTDFVSKLKSGSIKVLFVHGVNPAFELPKSLGFVDALANVPQVISFATFTDETAVQADYVFPDNHALESWGYQKVATGSNSSVLSGSQPVVVPLETYNSKPTVDVLLAAAQAAGGSLASTLLFKDEVEYLQSKFTDLIPAGDSFFTAPEINTFTAMFQQYGGWWKTTDDRVSPSGA